MKLCWTYNKASNDHVCEIIFAYYVNILLSAKILNTMNLSYN